MSHNRNIPQHPLAAPRRITQTKAKCTKRRYNNEIDAKLEVVRFQRIDDSTRSKIPCRAYECPRCGGWHLTAQPAITQATVENINGCTKRGFDTEELANKRLSEIRENPRTDVIPVRSYQCPTCSRWHLSSQPLEREQCATGRSGWMNEEAARRVLQKIRDNPREGLTVPKDVEFVEECQHWHLVH